MTSQVKKVLRTEEKPAPPVYGRALYMDMLGGLMFNPEHDGRLGLGPVRKVLLSGPRFCGKSALLTALGDMVRQAGGGFAWLEPAGEEEEDRLTAQVQDCFEKNSMLCLCAKKLETVEELTALELLAGLAGERETQLLIAVSTENPELVPEAQQIGYLHFPVGLPDEEDRCAYFTERFGTEPGKELLALLLRYSEGCDYTGLNTLASAVLLCAKMRTLRGGPTITRILKEADGEEAERLCRGLGFRDAVKETGAAAQQQPVFYIPFGSGSPVSGGPANTPAGIPAQMTEEKEKGAFEKIDLDNERQVIDVNISDMDRLFGQIEDDKALKKERNG